ncbi:MAG TPA: multifunctional CCA addition/repair protein [Chromatiales bacterium]|nr:multifunctional CCA addition/repair protein [Chromatiales bacterium]
MDVYLVGGAVRDELLGLPVKERDWVVVGARPEDLLAQGYKPVGKAFPVFLHPETHEEYALARTERKVAPGYHGFEFQATPDVTLREDLRRRDLTINALARDREGRIIDYYGGLEDLRRRVLRHVSEAFAEDPVRVLRVARFYARYRPLGFRIAAETRALMRRMVDDGEVDALVPERVWQELVRALAEPAPGGFVEALLDCGALARVFPEIDRLFGVPQRPGWHPEVDSGLHTLRVIEAAARLTPSRAVRFAALVHDLGKGVTPRSQWPSHRRHEAQGVPLVEGLCRRLRAPRRFRELGMLAARWHLHVHRVMELRPGTIMKVLERCNALRDPARFAHLLLACEADHRGRKGHELRPYPQRAAFLRLLDAARSIQPRDVMTDGLAGPEIGAVLRIRRIEAIRATLARLRHRAAH